MHFFFHNNNNNLFVMGFVVCERFPLCVWESLPPHSFIDGGFSFLSRGQGDWVKKRWTLLSGEIERDTDKKTRRRRRRPGPALKEKGGWRTGGFCWGLQRKWVKGLSHHHGMIITGVLFYIFMSLRSSSSSWLSLPVSSSLPPPKLTVLLLGKRRRGRRRLW